MATAALAQDIKASIKAGHYATAALPQKLTAKELYFRVEVHIKGLFRKADLWMSELYQEEALRVGRNAKRRSRRVEVSQLLNSAP